MIPCSCRPSLIRHALQRFGARWSVEAVNLERNDRQQLFEQRHQVCVEICFHAAHGLIRR